MFAGIRVTVVVAVPFFLVAVCLASDLTDVSRIWTDQRGRTMQGKIAYVDDRSVCLIDGRGKEHILNLSEFSELDQKYLRQQSEPTATKKTKSTDGKQREVVSANSGQKHLSEDEISSIRIWNDKAGTHQTKARFLAKTGDNVKLQKVDGKIIDVAMDKLSSHDQSFASDAELKRSDDAKNSQATAQAKKSRPAVVATPQNAATSALGMKSGDTLEIAYSYPYRGAFITGTSKFVFTLRPMEYDQDKERVKLELRSIQRYWNDERRETNIKSMPFTDPRGYHVYEAPPAWAGNARIGGSVWIDVETLKEGQDSPGEVSTTNKGESIAIAVIGTAIVAQAVAKAAESSEGAASSDSKKPKRKEGHYEERLLTCSSCKGRGKDTGFWAPKGGLECRRCGGSGIHTEKVWVPD